MPDRNAIADAPGGNTIGLAIAGAIMLLLALLPFVLVVILYLFLSGYALVHGIGSGQGEDAVIIVIGFVLTTTLFALLITLSANLIGRSLTPRKRRKSD